MVSADRRPRYAGSDWALNWPGNETAVMNTSTAALLLATGLAAGACAHSDVRQHAALDPDAKTISMPPPKRGLLRGLGETLRAEGWKIEAAQTAAAPKKGKPSGSPPAAAPAAAAQKAPPHARYSLTVEARLIERCRSGGPLYIYELRVVDNRGGGKVLEQSGRDCEREILEKFKEALRAQAKPGAS